MIKRFVIAAALLCLVGVDAYAAVNTRQNGDGTASVVGSSDATRFGNCFGGQVVQIPTQLNSTASQFGLSTVSNAVIKGAYLVNPIASQTGDTAIHLYAGSAANPVTFFNATTGNSTPAVINVSTGAAGKVSRISTLTEAAASGLRYNTLEEGSFIGLGSSGGVTTSGSASQVYIQVCPR